MMGAMADQPDRTGQQPDERPPGPPAKKTPAKKAAAKKAPAKKVPAKKTPAKKAAAKKAPAKKAPAKKAVSAAAEEVAAQAKSTVASASDAVTVPALVPDDGAGSRWPLAVALATGLLAVVVVLLAARRGSD
jgi:outer membrane biosynthesis protein TonB